MAELTAREELATWQNCRDRGCTCDRPRLRAYDDFDPRDIRVRVQHQADCPLWRNEDIDEPPPRDRTPDAIV